MQFPFIQKLVATPALFALAAVLGMSAGCDAGADAGGSGSAATAKVPASGSGASTKPATGAGPGRAGSLALLNVSYDPTRELYEEVNRLFAERYKAEAGAEVTVEQSHGGSSK